AQIIAAGIAFRRWALTGKEEFGLVFANPITALSLENRDEISGSKTGDFFSELLEKVFVKYQFPVPSVDELDPDVVKALREPFSAAIPCQFPDEVLGLGWVFMRSWASLYGTVTLEVFGHLDPYIIESGAMFRTMLEDQAEALGFGHELPRLRPLMVKEMGR
ncbi:MAG: TetR-like C-terminal domain-containing protein, partial [Actinomycetes bacterium]